MQPLSIVSFLQQYYDPQKAARILAVLRQDPLVQQSLKQEIFLRQIAPNIRDGDLLWKPGCLALLLLGEDFSWIKSDNLDYDFPLPITQKASAAYQDQLSDPKQPADLAHAGKISLAIRDIVRKSGSWEDILKGVIFQDEKNDLACYNSWRTVFTCLYTYVRNPDEMLYALVESGSPFDGFKLAAHVLLSNCDEQTLIEEKFVLIFPKIPYLFWVKCLNWLNRQGQSQLAKRTAVTLEDRLIQSPQDHLPVRDSQIETVLEIRHRASLLQISGQNDRAMHILAEARDLASDWVNRLEAQMICSASQVDQAGQIQVEKQLKTAMSPRLQAELLVALNADIGNIEEIDQLIELVDYPLIQIKLARRIAKEQGVEAGRKLASESVGKLLNQFTMAEQREFGELDYGNEPSWVISDLMTLELFHEALQLGLKFLESRSNDTKLMNMVSDLYIRNGDLVNAYEISTQSVTLSPESAECHRKLADVLEAQNQWEQAFDERQKVLQFIEIPLIDDWVSFGYNALKISQPRLAVDAGQVILEMEPNHPVGFHILGTANHEMGDLEGAEKFLKKSIQYSPDQAEPSILLANIYQQTERVDLAFEILKMASDKSSHLVDVHIALADLSFEQGLNEQGLAVGKMAYSLNPESLDAVKLYGKALLLSEHDRESEDLITAAYNKWPEDLQLAFLLAQIKLNLDQREFALSLLEKVVTSPDAEDGQKLVYVKTILGGDVPVVESSPKALIDQANLEKARSFLDDMLPRNPQSFEMRLLASEIYAIQGEDAIALESYQKAGDFVEANQQEWCKRISQGLGQVAFRLEKYDMALVALQSLWEDGSREIWLARLLAETYLALNLNESAGGIAKTVVEKESNWQILSWYSWILSSLGKEDQALSVLESAIKTGPQSPGTLLEMADVLLSAGNCRGAEYVAEHTLMLVDLEIVDIKAISYVLQKAGKQEKATAAMERAVLQDGQFTQESFIELLALYSHTSQFVKAYEMIGSAPQTIQNDISIKVLASDFLRVLERWSEAIEILEEVLHLEDPGEESVMLYQWHCEESDGSFDYGFDLIEYPTGIFTRLASLLYFNGSYSQALQQAKKGLEIDPTDPTLLQIVFSLHQVLVATEESEHFIENVKSVFNHYSDQSISSISSHQVNSSVSGLLGHYIEWALTKGDYELAGRLLNNVCTNRSHIRFISLSIRLLILEGKLAEANEQYSRLNELFSDLGEKESKVEFGDYSIGLEDETRFLCEIWWSGVAFAIQDYGQCLMLSESASQQQNTLPLAQLSLVNAILACNQEYFLNRELKIRNNKTCRELHDDELMLKYEEALTYLKAFLDGERWHYWAKKGAMVLRPTNATISEFMECVFSLDDAPAILISLREAGETSEEVIHMYEQYEGMPNIQGQLALSSKENSTRALEFANQAIEIAPNDPRLLMILALSAHANDDYPLAYQSIQKALRLWPHEAEWCVFAAEMAIKVSRTDEVFSHFNQAVSIAPDLIDKAQLLGETLLQEGDISNAIKLLEGSYRDSNEDLGVLITLGEAYKLDGQLEKALETGDRVCRFDPALSDAQKFCGQIAADMGKDVLALKYLRKAIQANPSDSETAITLSRILVEQDDWHAGLKVLDGHDHTNMAIALERAKIIYRQGGLTEAVPLVEEIIRQKPDDDEAVMLLAQMKLESGDGEEARDLLKKVLKKKPDHAAAYALLGWLSYFDGQLDQAVHSYSEAVRYCPTELDHYLKLGKIFHERREFTKALQIHNQAMKVAPKNAAPFLESSVIFKEMKDFVNAELMLRRAAELEPGNLSIQRQLGALVAINLVHNT
jgi:tetratricopeptide (TPR) repeat protein